VPIQLKNTANIEQPWTRWFLYGPTGSGKTTAASTFPSPLFIVPANEKSIVSLLGHNFDYVEVSSRKDMGEVLAFLRDRYTAALGGDENAFPWETVVVESLSHYCELLVEDISKKGQTKMDQQAWGLLSSHLRTLHSQLSDMDVHVVYTSLEQVDDAGQGRPLMTGKNAIMVPSACDVIGFCEAVPGQKKITHRIHFQQYGRYPARSRFRGLPAHIDDFHFDAVRDVLGGGE
jgi:hypothetical protein